MVSPVREPLDEFVEAHIRGLSDGELLALVGSTPPVFTAHEVGDALVARFLTLYLAHEWPRGLAVARQELARRGTTCESA